MNAHQRRTVRRALDRRAPYGAAVERKRRNVKRAKRPTRAERMRRAYNAAGAVDLEAVIAAVGGKESFAPFDHTPKIQRFRDGEATIID